MSTLLEEGGADVNLQDSEGITALHWACSGGHVDTVQMLLMAGANPNLLEVDGERLTPLDYAIIGGHQEVAQVLIEQGALSISSIQELAAIMIQKCVRGYLVRRMLGQQVKIDPHDVGAVQEPIEEDVDGPATDGPATDGPATDGTREAVRDDRRR